MNKQKLEKLHKLMLKANNIAMKGQLIEHKIREMELAVFKDNFKVITESGEWEDEIVAGYSNAEFNYLTFEQFEIKINNLINDVNLAGEAPK